MLDSVWNNELSINGKYRWFIHCCDADDTSVLLFAVSDIYVID